MFTRTDFPAPARLPEDRTISQLFFTAACILAVFSLPLLFQQGQFSGRAIGTYSIYWVLLLAGNITLALLGLAGLVFCFSPSARRSVEPFFRMQQALSRVGWLSFAAFGALWLLYVLVILYRLENNYPHFLPRVWLFWLTCGIGAFFLKAGLRSFGWNLSFFFSLAITAVLYGAGIKALGYLPEISRFPFSLSWSEASRYYYASLPYSGRLYGVEIPLSPWHPSRYLLLGIPFWFAELPLWAHRLWQVFLWLSLSFAGGLALARRLRLQNRWAAGLTALWAALFFLQGPVYYHLHISVLIVLIGFDRDRFWKSLLAVVLASLWAGISRVNWFPVPAFLAAALYFLEKPVCSTRDWLRYLLPVAGLGAAGGLAALAGQAGYIRFAGHADVSAFGSSFTSDLLWYRLLPSPTYPLGVLPAILLVSLPLLILAFGGILLGRRDWHAIRIFGLAAVLLVLFAGGLVVSTKIGGGSNIHNLDAFLVLLCVVGSYITIGRHAAETGLPARVWSPWPLVLLAVLTPVVWNINVGDPFIRRNIADANAELSRLSAVVQEFGRQGEVLFITQRQLIMFDYIPGARMVSDYELLTLSEMAISNNQTYLERFYNDLQRHRFSLIVVNTQTMANKNPLVDGFAEENNAWVEKISTPLMKYYQRKYLFELDQLDALVPRP